MLIAKLCGGSAHAVVAAYFVLLALAGCNTDPFTERQQAPKGPVLTMHETNRPDSLTPLNLGVGDQQEVDIVENLVTHREQYRTTLETLRNYYREHGYATKEKWADFELQGLRKVKSFKYLLDSEIPEAELRPTSAIPEADELYEKGMQLLKKGGYGTPVFYKRTTMLQAAETLQQVIERFPSSDKIDDAAFFLGEIHKEYFKDQEQIAVKWYERSLAWDPQTPHPVRFQAAVVYDYRLHDRDRALELYHAVVEEETADQSNVRFASRRIRELTEKAERPTSNG